MKDELFDVLVLKVTYWLLNQLVIEELLKFNFKNYFIIYKNIFLIKSLYDKINKSSIDDDFKKETLIKLNEGGIKINDLKPSSIIDYLIEWCKQKNEKKIFFYLYDFIIAISKNNDINIKKELRVESASFILKHYTQTISKINNQEVESLINIIIDFLKDEMFNKDDYKQILSSILDNIFDDVKLFLMEEIGDYKGCLGLFLDEKSNLKNKNDEIYKWINKLV